MGASYAQDGGTRGDDLVTGPPAAVADLLRAARRDRSRVLLEGVHAVKHATRFGADVEVVATPDRRALADLLRDLAPDVATQVLARTVELSSVGWARVVPRELPSPALGLAVRPTTTPADVLHADGPVVALEAPRHLGNLGAVVRVAAAADAGGVLVIGDADPWHPTAVRGAAGLGFALRVAASHDLPATQRPILALDTTGEPLAGRGLPADAVLLVGTERGGLSAGSLDRADGRVAIPMRAGVSSLNLATAVAIALYAGR
jgi:RNA methyltransferase, TrmH family